MSFKELPEDGDIITRQIRKKSIFSSNSYWKAMRMGWIDTDPIGFGKTKEDAISSLLFTEEKRDKN